MYSEPYKITYGTAQGLCLGPLLFIIFCNDIHALPLCSNVILFADDTTLSNSHKNRNYLQYTLEHDMLLLTDWFRAHHLSPNIDKTVAMLFWPNGKTLDIKVDGFSISTVSCTKFLGIMIDMDLSWKDQCSSVYNKLLINKQLLYLSKHLLNHNCMKNIYYAHIYSHMTYGLSVWGSMAQKKDINSIYKWQKACIRTLVGVSKNAHTHPLF